MSPNSLKKICLRQQTELNRLLNTPGQFKPAMQLFYRQHAMLHSADVSGGEFPSYADQVLVGLSHQQMRVIPGGALHSVVWLIFHMARCEDITMNLLVSNRSQVLLEGDLLHRLNVSVRDTGNAMTSAEIINFSSAVNVEELLAYRSAVGRATRQIACDITPEILQRRVDPDHMHRVWQQGALVQKASAIGEYWSKRSVAGLLLMPATRHNLTHLNEIASLKLN